MTTGLLRYLSSRKISQPEGNCKNRDKVRNKTDFPIYFFTIPEKSGIAGVISRGHLFPLFPWEKGSGRILMPFHFEI